MTVDALEPFESSKAQRKQVVAYVDSLFETVTHWPSTANPDPDRADAHVQLLRPQCMQQNASAATRCILRPVTVPEMESLTRQCLCTSDCWDNVFVMYFLHEHSDSSFTDTATAVTDWSEYLSKHYYQCAFAGYVVLGVSTETFTAATDDDILPVGVRFNTRIVNSILEPNCSVYHNIIISNTFIASTASVIHCGTIRWKKKDSSQGTACTPLLLDTLDITVGPETGGGRLIHVMAESTMMDVVASLQPHSTSSLSPWTQSMEPCCTTAHNIILGSVSHMDSIVNVYSDFSSILQSCPFISNTILLPQASITHGCIVENALLQWNASITNHSTVSSTLLMEQSHIGPNSVVHHTVLGPDSHVSCGEVHCSVIGPNTNAHHQSLIISTLWPLGRGNVAYGCNMGSNHTGRLPDQEMMSGEGIFYGLSTSLKFPIDVCQSPYSIVAAGICLPPQRISMPFSLITNSSTTSCARNEIVPGWVLQSSPYTLFRNEVKFKTRRKALRHSFYTGWTIVRPSIVNCCYMSRKALLGVKKEACHASGFYDHISLPALGLNVMTEKGRNIGIQAYSNLIQRYALQGLFEYVSATLQDPMKINELLNALQQQRRDYEVFESYKYESMLIDMHVNTATFPLPHKSLNHALFILLLEYPGIIQEAPSATNEDTALVLSLLFEKWMNLEKHFVQGVMNSKMRDEIRGSEIIIDYGNSHVLAENDTTVRLAYSNMLNVETDVLNILSKIRSIYSSRQVLDDEEEQSRWP